MKTVNFDKIKEEPWMDCISDIFLVDDLRKLPVDICDEPVALNMMLIGICEQGRINLTIDGKEVKIGKNSVFVLFPKQTISEYMISPDIKGGCIVFPSKKVDKMIYLNKQVWNTITLLVNNPVLEVSEEEHKLFEGYYNIASYIINHSNPKYTDELSSSLLHCILLHLLNVTDDYLPKTEQTDANMSLSSGDLLFQRFMMLINEHGGRLRSVSECAALLNITPKYLSLVVKNSSGKTALQWIHEVIYREIEKQMRFSDKNIKQIAMDLDFPSLSFFTRFFREHFGTSPTEYRKSIGK